MLDAALEHVNKQLGAFAVFSIAVPIAEWKKAKELRVFIQEAVRLEPELQQWCYADLSDDNNFEMLFKVYAAPPLHIPPPPSACSCFEMLVQVQESAENCTASSHAEV